MSRREPGYPFSFEPSACAGCPGHCCTGSSGKIWVTPQEVQGIAQLLELAPQEVEEQYTYRVGNRISLKEKAWGQDEFACIFFNGECSIYESRPRQCRTFPFWPRYKDQRLGELTDECPGVSLDDGLIVGRI